MRLSTKMRYAARALAEVGSMNNPQSVREVARIQKVSVKYLEQIFGALSSAGLLTVTRGKRGGHALAKPAQEISLRDVLEALEGPLVLVPCVDDPERCSLSSFCPTRETWAELQHSVLRVLDSTTVQQLVERKLTKMPTTAVDYQI